MTDKKLTTKEIAFLLEAAWPFPTIEGRTVNKRYAAHIEQFSRPVQLSKIAAYFKHMVSYCVFGPTKEIRQSCRKYGGKIETIRKTIYISAEELEHFRHKEQS